MSIRGGGWNCSDFMANIRRRLLNSLLKSQSWNFLVLHAIIRFSSSHLHFKIRSWSCLDLIQSVFISNRRSYWINNYDDDGPTLNPILTLQRFHLISFDFIWFRLGLCKFFFTFSPQKPTSKRRISQKPSVFPNFQAFFHHKHQRI